MDGERQTMIGASSNACVRPPPPHTHVQAPQETNTHPPSLVNACLTRDIRRHCNRTQACARIGKNMQ